LSTHLICPSAACTPRSFSLPANRRTTNTLFRGFCLAGILLLSSTLLFGTEVPKRKGVVQPTVHAAIHPVVVKISDSRVAPVPASEKPVSYHAPFDSGDCSICHQGGDTQKPGPVKNVNNELCLGCHDDFHQTLTRKFSHPPAQKNCLNCHNPHNSAQQHLLLEEPTKLCLGCHNQMKMAVSQAKVKHAALTQGDKCLNCHNAHGANVEHLLQQLPMQLCLTCHGKDDAVDHAGKKLTNMKQLLADNPNHHAPVAAEDCSACHKTHGGSNFRLLTNDYPASFYSPYDAKNYALCFSCHEEKVFTAAQTEELTQFRDGSRNLHYLHVNKTEMGRSCRACHEVHASQQDHHIRDSVPYGSKGWMLKVNFVKSPTGGSCSRTCHATKTYNNTRTSAAEPAAAAAAPAKP